MNDCSSVELPGSWGANISDLAFHPDGTLYVITYKKLYYYDFAIQDLVLIGSLFNNDDIWMNSLVCGSDGKIYGAGADPSNSFYGRFYEINPTTGAATNLGELPVGAAGDLAFMNGKLYLTGRSNASNPPSNQQLVEVNILNPENSVPLCELDLLTYLGSPNNLVIYGLVSYTNSCGESTLMAGIQTIFII